MSEDAITRPMGRPSKYQPEFCERVIELGCQGASRVEIAFEIGVGTTTLQRWENEHEDFRVAMVHAKEAEQVWWERKGRSNLATQGFQSSMWSRSMAARFSNDWREKSEQDLNLRGELKVTEIKRTIIDPRNPDA